MNHYRLLETSDECLLIHWMRIVQRIVNEEITIWGVYMCSVLARHFQRSGSYDEISVFISFSVTLRGEFSNRQPSAKPQVDSLQIHQLGMPESTGKRDGFAISCLAPILSFSKKKISFDHNLINTLMLKIWPSQNHASACLLHWLLTILIQIIRSADIYNNLNQQSILWKLLTLTLKP